MKPEPDLDHSLLLSILRQSYGIRAERLVFVPVGFVADSYVVECLDQDQRYFLKVWNDQSHAARTSAGQLDIYLPLTDQLVAAGLRVPRYLPARNGQNRIQSGSLTLALYDYLPYPTLDALPARPPDLPARLGSMAAQVHRATAAVDTHALVREMFQAPFYPAMIACLAELETVSVRRRPGQQALRELILPRREHILALYHRLVELSQTARELDPRLTLVHTDLQGSNLMLAENGDLVILDWDSAMLAPAEHDLFIFAGDHFPATLRAYRKSAGPVDLHAETFGFYFYRRNLEDLTDWLQTILHENANDQQDQHDLTGIQHDCIDGWPWLERRIDQVREQLRQD